MQVVTLGLVLLVSDIGSCVVKPVTCLLELFEKLVCFGGVLQVGILLQEVLECVDHRLKVVLGLICAELVVIPLFKGLDALASCLFLLLGEKAEVGGQALSWKQGEGAGHHLLLEGRFFRCSVGLNLCLFSFDLFCFWFNAF